MSEDEHDRWRQLKDNWRRRPVWTASILISGVVLIVAVILFVPPGDAFGQEPASAPQSASRADAFRHGDLGDNRGLEFPARVQNMPSR